MKEQTKPCPFCGIEGALWRVKSDNEKLFWFECAVCHAHGPTASVQELAIVEWNRRNDPIVPYSDSKIDELRKAINDPKQWDGYKLDLDVLREVFRRLDEFIKNEKASPEFQSAVSEQGYGFLHARDYGAQRVYSHWFD